MHIEKSNLSFLILFLLLGAILCSALGFLIVKFIPQLNIITQNLTDPLSFDIVVITFSLKINLCAILGLILGFIVFRKV